MSIVQEGYFDVTLTLKISTTVDFSPIERDSVLTERDGINNAIGSIGIDTIDAIVGDGFSVDSVTGVVNGFRVSEVK